MRHEDSHILEEYIVSSIAPHIVYTGSQLSKQNMILVENIYREIESANNQYVAPANLQIKNTMIKSNEFAGIPGDIQTNIENMLNVKSLQHRMTIKTGSVERVVEINLQCSQSNVKKYEMFFGEALRRIVVWLTVAFNYAPAECSRRLNIYIYFTDLKKTLPTEAASAIKQEHANTAFTYSCKSSNEINVFRYEEWFKVLIHESFHSLGMDFSQFNRIATNECILKLFNVNSDVRLYETYCEVWAELLNAMFITYFYDKRENLNRFIYLETIFSGFQCCKVLKSFGLNYEKMYNKTKETKDKYTEETHVLSYYVLKPVCLFYVNDFLEWCREHNGEKVLCFGRGGGLEKNLADYCEFFEKRYSTKEYLSFMRGFSDLENPTRNFETGTLRMTIFG
jgi:hypothetical protein